MNDDKNIREVLNAGDDLIESVTDKIGDVLTGIPAPIRKNFAKAFAQLCTATVDIPVAYLEGKATEMRAETNARIKLIEAGADQIASQMQVDPEYAHVAVKKFGQKIIREQINLDKIAETAKQELLLDAQETSEDGTPDKDVKEISEDWLNAFEKEACSKSSDEMRNLFGKILAGEIKRPSSYSIRTVKLLSQLDNQAAKLFQLLCSMSISQQVNGHVLDARVVSLSGQAGSNSLSKYGLSFDNLNVLHEYGLIIADYNSYMPYGHCIAQNEQVPLPFMYHGMHYALVHEDGSSKDLKLHGVALTKSGKELLNVVDFVSCEKYTNDLISYFKNIKYKMISVRIIHR